MDADEIALQKCKGLIEQKIGWEGSEQWSNHDFHILSTRIQDETGVSLSVATLKRIWGKVRYDSKPTITTLNTLAQFTGHDTWRSFRQKHLPANGNGTSDDQRTIRQAALHILHKRAARSLWRKGLVAIALCSSLVFLILYLVKREAVSNVAPGEYQFSSKKVVSEGVPNSVIFDYDATASPVDSIYIQQSWDERLRTRVSKNQHQHTSIYYTPGFFQAKLVVSGQVVKEHNLLIKSGGWLALVRQDPVPVYFQDTDFMAAGMLSLPISKLKENNIPLQPNVPVMSYYNVGDFGDVRTDNFSFEAEVRNDFGDGAAACRFTQILLLTEGNVIIIPLSIKGCVSELGLMFGEGVDGKKTDLSAFGCDIEDWVKVRCAVDAGKGEITIDDQVAYRTAYPRSDKIVGMIIRFQGTGSVRDIRLRNGHEIAFADNFQK